MGPVAVSLIALAVICGGAFAGARLRGTLPGDHLSADAKDIVRLGAGLIATIAALVLGLLIASAKSSYDTQSGHVMRVTANIILLDQLLMQYGPEARTARDLLRRAVGPLVEQIWRENGAESAKAGRFRATAVAEDAYAQILDLSPQSEAQRALKARAIEVSTELAQTRLALFVEGDGSLPMPFLVVLVFWLAIIFMSFSLFSKLNPTVITALFIFALSASGALFLILELSQPFAGLMQISSEPLRNVLAPI